MGFNGDGGEAENENFLAKPDVITGGKTPWEGNIHLGTDYDPLPYPRAEEAQESDAQA